MYIPEFIHSNLGLILNIIGSILVVVSIGKFPDGFGGSTTSNNGREYHFAYVTRPTGLKIGLLLIIIGFIVQILEKY
ncbi:MAG: hypothetical protein A3I92_00570 [Candidatus Yanofskybacteria bacterium RIFCSPLOWO2_02_FULL_43_10b]|uniref:Uncharacterized protein n=1 Tax=Candidatus Yanofskybacteria bacterium RIFCSPLOWO2_02_FULL_43_10b TaxID=1802704 RepID=A0A1F8H1H3_9BACT|nr:MAG: hypothetical protein A3I92_00570 [Candidatus Yanofskybacteria bacterium RIFCSPLOWO2_02_FULL_43_10b]